MKYVTRPKDIDIDIDVADILGQKYWYRIDIGNDDIDPPLLWYIANIDNISIVSAL